MGHRLAAFLLLIAFTQHAIAFAPRAPHPTRSVVNLTRLTRIGCCQNAPQTTGNLQGLRLVEALHSVFRGDISKVRSSLEANQESHLTDSVADYHTFVVLSATLCDLVLCATFAGQVHLSERARLRSAFYQANALSTSAIHREATDLQALR